MYAVYCENNLFIFTLLKFCDFWCFSNHTHIYPFFPLLSRFLSINLKIIIYLRKNKMIFLVTVGTQAAVLAGLDVTMFIEFNPPDDHTWVS